jgi:NADH dehydrogenase
MKGSMKKRVIVIGGGYGGIQAVKELATNRDIEIIVLDQNGYHYLQTDVYAYIANKSNISDITVDLRSLFSGIREDIVFINDTVLEIDENVNRVKTVNGDYSYDYLIVATGSVTHLPEDIEGLKKYSHGVKSLHKSLEFKQKFEASIYNYVKYGGCAGFNIVIGGAGLSGVEIAAEMAYIRDIYLTTIGSGCKGVNIYLINGSGILKDQQRYIQKKSENRLEKLGVKLKVGVRIDKIDRDFVYFKNGEVLKYDFVIFTGGVHGNLIKTKKETSKNSISQYIVDEYFRIHENIFAVGDVAEVIDKSGEYVAPTAQVAEQMGVTVAKNIKRAISGKEMRAKVPKNMGFLVALGGKYATANLMNIVKFSGYKAYLFKHLVTEGYKIPLKLSTSRGREKR